VLILGKSPTFTGILRCLSGGGRRCHPPRYRRLPAVAGGFWTTASPDRAVGAWMWRRTGLVCRWGGGGRYLGSLLGVLAVSAGAL
jgi:hypothetical protein